MIAMAQLPSDLSVESSTGMRIDLIRSGKFVEVGFTDFERDGLFARSGYMTAEEAAEFAGRLREIAAELERTP